MEKLLELIKSFTFLGGISGRENRASDDVLRIIREDFDETQILPTGSIVGIKRCGISGAPSVMLEAHLDEIGLLVTAVCEGGFLKITRCGGVDKRTLMASKVKVYAKSGTLTGVITSTPPHLQTPGSAGKLFPPDELYIDTGLSCERAEELIPIGTPVGFDNGFSELLNGRIASKSLDNRVCCASVARAVQLINADKRTLSCDIYAVFASQEETTGVGAGTAAYKLSPDAAIITDVDFAEAPGTEKHETLKLGGGAAMSFSATLNRKLTLRLRELAKNTGIPVQVTVYPSQTGTDAAGVWLAREGIPCVLAGVPLANMHSTTEIISTDDAMRLSELMREFCFDFGNHN